MSGNMDPMAADRRGDEDAKLVRSALGGELGAFDSLVGRYQRQATAVAYRLLNNRDDAMEVVQDSFLKAYEKLDSLSKPGRFGAWLMRIVTNLSLNRRRARALRQAASLDEFAESGENRQGFQTPDPRAAAPDQAASTEDLKGLINTAIEELPEAQRKALLLFSVARMPQKQVAETLGCSIETVKWNVFTARRKLKEILKEYL